MTDRAPTTGQFVRVLALGCALLWLAGAGQPGAASPWPFVTLSEDDFRPRDPAKEALGQALFFDKLLSGNLNISCATCHHPLLATGDGLSLPIGEGGRGLGVVRSTGVGAAAVVERVPRNAPPLFNLGAKIYTVMFDDGRVAVAPEHPSGFHSPAGDDLPPGLDSALAVQAMFPVTSAAEMAGQAGENPIAAAAEAGRLSGPAGVWAQLAERLRAVPAYMTLFEAAFPDVAGAEDITFVHAANALAAYQAAAFRCTDAPYDRYAAGDLLALSNAALIGSQLFTGKAGCASCHSGPLQTDLQFYAIGVPQIGPGKGDNLSPFNDGLEDFGRERVTGETADRCRFRTPSLRQVALTGPWGHDGAYNDLEAMVRHHLNAAAALDSYDPSQAVLPSRPDLDALDTVVHRDPLRRAAIASTVELPPVHLSDDEVDYLLAFLHALTDPGCLDLRHTIPTRVPSGLPLYD